MMFCGFSAASIVSFRPSGQEVGKVERIKVQVGRLGLAGAT